MPSGSQQDLATSGSHPSLKLHTAPPSVCFTSPLLYRHLQCSAVTIRTTQGGTYSALLSQYRQHKVALTVLCCHNTDNTRRHLQCSAVTIQTTQGRTYSSLLSQYGQHNAALTVLCCQNTDNIRRHLQCSAVTMRKTKGGT